MSGKKFFIYTFFLVILIFLFFIFKEKNEKINFNSEKKAITFIDENTTFTLFSSANDVEEFLKENKIIVSDGDFIFPNKDTKIFSGSIILLNKLKKITIKEGKNSIDINTTKKTVGGVIFENKNIKFDQDDLIEPEIYFPIRNNDVVMITHVEIEEEIKNEPIKYKTIENEDDSLGWREKKVTQKGENGNILIKYKVVKHNEKEISRKILEKNITKEAIEEIVSKGTYVKVGKLHSGLGSWYAQPKHLETNYPSITGYYAANPWLPMGSYAKVTNKENGQSVIVRINDRGPFGPNRIIDLGKNAFSAVASLGAGIIDVKMEEIKN